ncbi:solute-binding protein [Streptomyces capoamus]|uniref:Solute-binding protein n=1 Tax=Streptomyces capoamus TaxID=68183 RepID=A0A919C1A0_9ACTN|nr:substrate-binding domain-containing protein [Streptomyces capoamus]GGW12511.1 solute-binding protein [Streptomyces libani subsp. rufus]GHG34801.1 solute-binding protein [Streptomyces capoamus]
MRAFIRNAAVVVAAASTTLAAVSCGSGTGNTSAGKDPPVIGVLLPDATTARWETRDRPLLEKRIKELCDDCRIEHANARGDVAIQQEQMDSLITEHADAILLVPVDARALAASVRKAHAAGIPVISYDRLADGPVSGYVSFDGQEVGRLQGRALLRAMGDKAHGGRIVMMNGDPSDPNAVSFKRGALSVLQGKVEIAKAYDTLMWRTEAANRNMAGALSALGAGRIDGVYAANDGLAAGSITALKANKVRPLPPVTGQDAELAAVRRIVAGEQYETVYKPFGPEASAGGAMAVAAARGSGLDRVATGRVTTSEGTAVPAVRLTPVSVTAADVKRILVKDGAYTVRQICTPQLAAACARAGLT